MAQKVALRLATEDQVVDWLKRNDEELFLGNKRVADARRLCEKALGLKVPTAMFRSARGCCEFWKKIPRREYSSQVLLNWREWDRFRQWCMREENLEIVRQCRSIDLVAAVMRAEGIAASPELLRNSCSFMSVWRRERKDKRP